jgi:hypothetical protein
MNGLECLESLESRAAERSCFKDQGGGGNQDSSFQDDGETLSSSPLEAGKGVRIGLHIAWIHIAGYY